jgi:hypothetical protein
MRLDEAKIAATRGVDWHGNDVRALGSQWNQWESGVGTGGAKVRAYKTDEYMHGENLHTSDESQDSEEEVPEEKKTLVQRKRDKEKSPGLFPAPELESWRWTATPGRVVGLVLSGRACSGMIIAIFHTHLCVLYIIPLPACIPVFVCGCYSRCRGRLYSGGYPVGGLLRHRQ